MGNMERERMKKEDDEQVLENKEGIESHHVDKNLKGEERKKGWQRRLED